MKIQSPDFRKRSIECFLIASILISTLLSFESHAEVTPSKTRRYLCRCKATTLSKVNKKADCNMRGFSLGLSEGSATIEDYFQGKLDQKKKSKQDVVFYRGFEQMDFHYQFVLEVERKLLANDTGKTVASKNGKAWLNVSGEKNFRETFNCEQK